VVIVPSTVLSDGVASHADASLAERFGGLTAHTILGGSTIAADAAAKRRLYAATQAHAIDLESGAVAAIAGARGLPFIVIRAICDPAERDLPPAALTALDPDGAIGLWGVLRSLLGNPRQIPGLLALAHDAKLARRALLGLADRVGANRQAD
jgi:adenosylhomocysteine nucleosidase